MFFLLEARSKLHVFWFNLLSTLGFMQERLLFLSFFLVLLFEFRSFPLTEETFDLKDYFHTIHA